MALKALVADDDEMMLELLESILELKGYHITKVTDGDQAIRKLNAADFDLVITDLQMGSTSGIDVIRKAKNINSNTTVIMITGSCDSADKVKAFRQGADDYLSKPFSPADLLISIQFQLYKQIVTSPFAFEDEQCAATCQDKLQSVKGFCAFRRCRSQKLEQTCLSVSNVSEM